MHRTLKSALVAAAVVAALAIGAIALSVDGANSASQSMTVQARESQWMWVIPQGAGGHLGA